MLITTLELLGSILLVFWGVGGLLPIPYYRMAGFIGGILFLTAAVLLLRSPVIPQRRGLLFKESHFDTVALYIQRLWAIMEIVIAFIIMTLPPSKLSVGLIGITLGGYGFVNVMIWFKSSKYLGKIKFSKISKFGVYYVLICSIAFIFGGLILIWWYYNPSYYFKR